jgi:hypothetical protein
LGLSSSNEQLFSLGSDGDGLPITEAQIGIQQLAFVDCDEQAVTQVAGAVTVDLLDGDSVFEAPLLQSLCEAVLSLEPRDIGWTEVRPESSPQLSLGVAGLTTSATPWFVEDDAALSVTFRPAPFEVTAATEFVLSLDVATALNSDEVQQLTPDENGELVVTSQQNESVLLNIRQRWTSSWNLYATNSAGELELIAAGEVQ